MQALGVSGPKPEGAEQKQEIEENSGPRDQLQNVPYSPGSNSATDADENEEMVITSMIFILYAVRKDG